MKVYVMNMRNYNNVKHVFETDDSKKTWIEERKILGHTVTVVRIHGNIALFWIDQNGTTRSHSVTNTCEHEADGCLEMLLYYIEKDIKTHDAINKIDQHA